MWRRHRDWFERPARAAWRGADFGLAEIHKLYATLDQVLPLKEKRFDHLRDKWRELFGAKYEVRLYDLTSTYFETDTPNDPADPRRHGYSRDPRPDCPQGVIALVVTPEGLPLAYEVLPGTTADPPTRKSFLEKFEARYGQAQRVWLLDPQPRHPCAPRRTFQPPFTLGSSSLRSAPWIARLPACFTVASTATEVAAISLAAIISDQAF